MPTIDVDGCVRDAHGRLWRPPYSKWPHERPQHHRIESQFNLKRLTFYLWCKFAGHNWTSSNNPLPIPWFLCYACTVPWYFLSDFEYDHVWFTKLVFVSICFGTCILDFHDEDVSITYATILDLWSYHYLGWFVTMFLMLFWRSLLTLYMFITFV